MDGNDMFSQFIETQKEYRSKTAANKFSKEDLNAGRASRKLRESDTMAMLGGFKNTLFQARSTDPTEKETAPKGNAPQHHVYQTLYRVCVIWTGGPVPERTVFKIRLVVRVV